MNPHKSLGPDGMPLDFFPQYYKVVGSLITFVVLKSLNYGMFPSSITIPSLH